MGEKQIVEEFQQLHESSARSKAARLRDLFDQIEDLRERGFSHATIIEAMRKHGLEFDLKTFECTFYRIKKERMRVAATSGNRQAGNDNRPFLSDQIRVSGESNDKESQDKSLKSRNPLHALSAHPKKGDFNSIPKAKFEVDES